MDRMGWISERMEGQEHAWDPLAISGTTAWKRVGEVVAHVVGHGRNTVGVGELGWRFPRVGVALLHQPQSGLCISARGWQRGLPREAERNRSNAEGVASMRGEGAQHSSGLMLSYDRMRQPPPNKSEMATPRKPSD